MDKKIDEIALRGTSLNKMPTTKQAQPTDHLFIDNILNKQEKQGKINNSPLTKVRRKRQLLKTNTVTLPQ
jgi:hypothetical protein